MVTRLIGGSACWGGDFGEWRGCGWVGTSIVCGGWVSACLGDGERLWSGVEISSNWKDSGVRMGDWDVSDRYLLSDDEPEKFMRA